MNLLVLLKWFYCKNYHLMIQFSLIRGNLEAGQCQMESLKIQLSIQKRRLKTEEEFRKQVETDYRSLQEEKRSIDLRYSHLLIFSFYSDF